MRVDPHRIRPNRWNPNKMNPVMYRKELASIRKFGFIDPVTVRQLPSGGYEIIDGEHRWKAALELGLSEIPTFVVDVSDADAKQLTIVLNETRGRSDPKKLGLLLRDLVDTEDKTELLDLLPFSPPVFDQLIGEGDYDFDAETPTVPKSTWVERTFRMPRDAAETFDEAVGRMRSSEGEEIEEWRVLELLAAEYLSGS